MLQPWLAAALHYTTVLAVCGFVPKSALRSTLLSEAIAV